MIQDNLDDVRIDQKARLDALVDLPERTVSWRALELTVGSYVFPPGGTDTDLLGDYVVETINSRTRAGLPTHVLEVTGGSGALSVLAAQHGATGVALDINPSAVQTMEKNFARYSAPFTATSNVDGLAALGAGPFDIIMANPPYLDEAPPGDYGQLAVAFYGVGTLLDDMFSNAASMLTDTGELVIVFAEWADVSRYEQRGHEHGWQYETVSRRASRRGPRNYRLDRWSRA